MALNKFMHPRNIYLNPPDFAKLAKSYEEFSSIAKVEVTGKVTIDFKNAHSLRVLTKCLLKADFGLDVVIPEDRLVPTLPLRLNYVLWIEDLMNSIGRTDNISGIDIGTGACAIYPLLAAVKNNWRMLGTESDTESLQKAQENIERNNLQNLIKLIKNSTPSILEYLFSEENAESFDFCMCNPPFYSNLQELCESRSPARLPPKNGFTGSPQELITEGGELTFCRKMMKESKDLKHKILLFTTMVGHKYNLKELAQDLKAEGIEYTTTEFCQGRVTRWGLAWTYKDIPISKLVPGRDKSRKRAVPIVYLLPELTGSPYNIETVSKKILCILQGLKMDFKVLNKRGNHLSLDVKAAENTWSNQRKKRRLLKLQQQAKKPRPNESNVSVDGVTSKTEQISAAKAETIVNTTNVQTPTNSTQNGSKTNSSLTKDISDSVTNDSTENANNLGRAQEKSTSSNSGESFPQLKQLNESTDSAGSEYSGVIAEVDSLVHAFFKIVKKDNNILLEMEFLNGTAGKEGLHQIMQYIKNNWNSYLFNK